MTIERNALCPCGSGKKYKKCCLQKDQVIHLRQRQEERFFQLKHELTMNLNHFVQSKVPVTEQVKIKAKIEKALNPKIRQAYLQGFFNFYLNYFYEFQQGYRGINYFYDEHRKWLTAEENRMVSTWINMVPRVIIMIDQNEQGIIVEDCFTKEQFFMPYTQTFSQLAPWTGGVCFIEPFLEGYCIHGISVFQSPAVIYELTGKINELMKYTQKTYHEVVREHYLELLMFLENREKAGQNAPDPDSFEFKQTVLAYQLKNKEKAVSFLAEYGDLHFDEWKEENGILTLLGDWYRYEDNECPEPVYLAAVYAQIKIEDEKMTVSGFETEQLARFLEQLSQDKSMLNLQEKTEKALKMPVNAIISQYCIQMGASVPAYFGYFAQNYLSLVESLNKPLPLFHHSSPMEVAQNGRYDLLEAWLREAEYQLFALILAQFGKVSHTADFNFVRKKLGLPMSPFVTKGEARATTLERCQNPLQEPRRLNRDDIPFYQQLGFTPETAYQFYAQDIVNFYKEKTAGKSHATIQKYKTGLSLLAEFLNDKNVQINSWQECSHELWIELLSFHYLMTHFDASINQASSFFSTIKSFLKWLDTRWKTDFGKMSSFLPMLEEEVYDCIRLLDPDTSLYARRFQPEILRKAAGVLRGSFTDFLEKRDGLFQITKINSQYMTVCDLSDEKLPEYKVKIGEKQHKLLHHGMLLFGLIGRQKGTRWEIINLDRVLPGISLEFVE